jgi:hypothetical protein
VAIVTLGSSPGQLTRFGAHQAAAGLGGVEVQIFIRSDLADGLRNMARKAVRYPAFPEPDQFPASNESQATTS